MEVNSFKCLSGSTLSVGAVISGISGLGFLGQPVKPMNNNKTTKPLKTFLNMITPPLINENLLLFNFSCIIQTYIIFVKTPEIFSILHSCFCLQKSASGGFQVLFSLTRIQVCQVKHM